MRGLQAGAVAAAIALAAIALLLGVSQLTQFWDPCHTWGDSGAGAHSVSPGDPCASSSSSSLTKRQEGLMLGFIWGVPAALGIVAAWAAARGRGVVLVVCGILVVVHSVPLFFLGLPAVLVEGPVAAVLVMAGVVRPRAPAPETA